MIMKFVSVLILFSITFLLCGCGKEDSNTFHLFMPNNGDAKFHMVPNNNKIYPCWDSIGNNYAYVNSQGPIQVTLHSNNHASIQYNGSTSGYYKIFTYGSGSVYEAGSSFQFDLPVSDTITAINQNQRLNIPMCAYVSGFGDVELTSNLPIIGFKTNSPGITYISITSNARISGRFKANISEVNLNANFVNGSSYTNREIIIQNSSYGEHEGDIFYISIPKMSGLQTFTIKRNNNQYTRTLNIPNGSMEKNKVSIINLDNLLASGTKGMESPFEYSYEL